MQISDIFQRRSNAGVVAVSERHLSGKTGDGTRYSGFLCFPVAGWETHYLWRAVDHEGAVLEMFATKRRNRRAALKFLKRAMKRYGQRPMKIVFAAMAAALMLGAAPAGAQETGGAAAPSPDCAGIAKDALRLACYDRAAGRAKKSTPSSGRWQVWTKKDPLDNSTTTTATVKARSGKSRFGDMPAFVARCRGGKTSAYISWGAILARDYLAQSAEFKRVTQRIDGGKSSIARWSLSKDRKATFADAPIPLLKRLAAGRTFVAQVTPLLSSPITTVFDLTGARAAIGKIADECGWKLP